MSPQARHDEPRPREAGGIGGNGHIKWTGTTRLLLTMQQADPVSVANVGLDVGHDGGSEVRDGSLLGAGERGWISFLLGDPLLDVVVVDAPVAVNAGIYGHLARNRRFRLYP